jgi:Flp pilus assembly protein TadG
MVTAETAAVLPVLALLLAFGLWAVAAVGAQIRCGDAAREAARAAARGESPAQVRSTAARTGPARARLSVSEGGGLVTASVSTRVGPLHGWLPSLTVSGTATAAREPGTTP